MIKLEFTRGDDMMMMMIMMIDDDKVSMNEICIR